MPREEKVSPTLIKTRSADVQDSRESFAPFSRCHRLARVGLETPPRPAGTGRRETEKRSVIAVVRRAGGGAGALRKSPAASDRACSMRCVLAWEMKGGFRHLPAKLQIRMSLHLRHMLRTMQLRRSRRRCIQPVASGRSLMCCQTVTSTRSQISHLRREQAGQHSNSSWTSPLQSTGTPCCIHSCTLVAAGELQVQSLALPKIHLVCLHNRITKRPVSRHYKHTPFIGKSRHETHFSHSSHSSFLTCAHNAS